MRKISLYLLLSALLAIGLTGCSQEDNSSSIDILNTDPVMVPIDLPAGATLQSATFNIYLTQANAQPITIHRVNAPWDEMTVTWDNFGAAYDPVFSGVFIADFPGWKSVDVSNIVLSWLDGTYENNGLLIGQAVQVYPAAAYNSKEAGVNPPYIEICYSLNGEVTCNRVEVIGDAYIWELQPDYNSGTEINLATGWADPVQLEKKSLLQFEYITETQDNNDGDTTTNQQDPDTTSACTHSIGYWKNHCGLGPQVNEASQYLPIWLGTDGGAGSFQVTDSVVAFEILSQHTYGEPKNGITKLYAQLLAVKLNIAAGASPVDIADYLLEADAYLTETSWTDWESLSRFEKKDVRVLKSYLDDYNIGNTGPGHCDEIDSD